MTSVNNVNSEIDSLQCSLVNTEVHHGISHSTASVISSGSITNETIQVLTTLTSSEQRHLNQNFITAQKLETSETLKTEFNFDDEFDEHRANYGSFIPQADDAENSSSVCMTSEGEISLCLNNHNATIANNDISIADLGLNDGNVDSSNCVPITTSAGNSDDLKFDSVKSDAAETVPLNDDQSASGPADPLDEFDSVADFLFDDDSYNETEKYPKKVIVKAVSDELAEKLNSQPDSEFLKVLPPGYQYLIDSLTYQNDTNYTTAFRVKEIVGEAEARKWISEFCNSSLVTWKVAKTFPNSGKVNIYRTLLRCHHNVRKNLKKAQNPPARISKHTDCVAQLNLIVRRYLKNSRAKFKDPFVRDWPCIIEVKGNHNHPLRCADVLRFRPVSKETRRKLFQLFRKGHSPASAIEVLKFDIILEQLEKYQQYICDTHYIPTLAFCHHEYERVLKRRPGLVASPEQMLKELEKLVNNYNENQNHIGKAALGLHNRHVILTICTPIMSRAHYLIKESSELVLFNVFTSTEKQTRIYFLCTSANSGAIPLACMICDKSDQGVFSGALELLKTCLPIADDRGAFYGKSWPKIIMLEESNTMERIPLRHHFPNTYLLSCQSHVLNSVWNWLQDPEHNIAKHDREELYFLFKCVLYSQALEDCELQYFEFISRACAKGYGDLVNYMGGIWEQRDDWAFYYRVNIPVRGINTSKQGDEMFHLLREGVFNFAKLFNIVQLFDFITCTHEKYLERRLLDFATGVFTPGSISIFMPLKAYEIDPEAIEDIGNGCYKVLTQTENQFQVSIVDTQRYSCTCSYGLCGHLCQHKSAVMLNCGLRQCAERLACDSAMRQTLHEVATGKQDDEATFMAIKNQSRLKEEPMLIEIDVEPASITQDCNGFDESSSEMVPADAFSETDLDPIDGEEDEISTTMDKLVALCNHICNKVRDKPVAFMGAVQSMIEHAHSCKSDRTLLTAIRNFSRKEARSVVNGNGKKHSKRRQKVKVEEDDSETDLEEDKVRKKSEISGGARDGEVPEVPILAKRKRRHFLPLKKLKDEYSE